MATRARLNGYVRPTTRRKLNDDERLVSDLRVFQRSVGTSLLGSELLTKMWHAVCFAANAASTLSGPANVSVEDARAEQAKALSGELESPATFFAARGFILLPHRTELREEDWADSETVRRVYGAEVEKLIREVLLPNPPVNEREKLVVTG